MWYMFWCGAYNLYLTYTDMYIVDLIKFSLYYNALIQLLQESLINCYYYYYYYYYLVILPVSSIHADET